MDFSSIFEQKGYKANRWLSRYLWFIHKFAESKLTKNTHNHHILPKAIFEEYKSFQQYPENRVILSPRAHLIAHYLLAKAIGGNMWFAYNNMNVHNVKLSTRLYEEAQKNISIQQSQRAKEWMKNNEHPKGMKGKKHTKETKQLLSEKSSGRTHPNEIKKQLSENWHNKSEEEKKEINKKISQSKKGSKHTDTTKRILADKANERYANGFKIEKTLEQLKNQSKALKKHYKKHGHHTKGKTYEEIMGEDKAKKLKKKRSKNNPMNNKTNRDKVSKALKGIKRSDETKKKLSQLVPITDGEKNKRIVPELLDEHLNNGWKKGYTRKPEKTYKCEHCSKETTKGNLNRWHNNN